MPSATDPIITSQELTQYLEGDTDLYIQIASDAVRAYCHWHIWPLITVTQRLVGSGSAYQPLRTLRASAVSNLVVDGKLWEADRYELLPDAPNQIHARHQYNDLTGTQFEPWGNNHFPRNRPITVSLTHGYVDVPPGLKGVVLNMAARAKALPSTWLRSMSSDTYSYEFISGIASATGGVAVPSIGGIQLTADDLAQLEAYRIYGVA